jgi:hypothetical protein
MDWTRIVTFYGWLLEFMGITAGLLIVAVNAIEDMRRGRWRFSMRTLLIAMGLVALMLSIVLVPLRYLPQD